MRLRNKAGYCATAPREISAFSGLPSKAAQAPAVCLTKTAPKPPRRRPSLTNSGLLTGLDLIARGLAVPDKESYETDNARLSGIIICRQVGRIIADFVALSAAAC